ncbi:hypothetical protein CGRA01v4_00391 [Colletotrichum graminicola]|nr:hypothetical protein CGRA01v4_00391 [Colletotrichum graminicola]
MVLMRDGSAINAMVVRYVRNRPNVVNDKHPEDRSATLLVDSCSPPPGRRRTVQFSDANRLSPTRRRLVGRGLYKPSALTGSSFISLVNAMIPRIGTQVGTRGITDADKHSRAAPFPFPYVNHLFDDFQRIPT